MEKDPLVKPVVKWAGGKRQLLPKIKKEIPKKYSVYYEPFLGGGAVLFDLQPQKATVNDINEELINLYLVIRDNVDSLVIDLKKHKNDAEYFYKIRGLDRDKKKYSRLSEVERASRILYLNKTCFNGLYRVNQRGEFNVPFGDYKNPNIINEDLLRAVSNYFNKAKINLRCKDFAEAVAGIESGGFVYIDPPYDPISDSANFTAYDQGGFNRKEQKRLKELCDSLDRKGIKFLLSNSATDFILNLYKNYRVKIIQAKRAINAQGHRRGNVSEVLVKNYEN